MAVPLHITAPLAALTTIFTPPCTTSWLVATTRLPSQFPSFPAPGPATCDPPAWGVNLAGKGFQYYSPAICPDGFAVGTSCLVESETRTAEDFPAVTDGETAAWCVPSGHTCTSDTTDFRGGVWGVSRTDPAETGVTVTVGPALQIRWRDGDLANLATHPLTPGLTLAPPTTTSDAAPALTTMTATAVPIPRLTGNSAATADNDDDDTTSTQTESTSTKSLTAAVAPTRTGSTTHIAKSSPAATSSAPVSASRHTAFASSASAASRGSSGGDSSGSSVVTGTAAAATAAATTHSFKGAGAPSVHRLVIALVVVSLVGVVASGLAVAFFFSVRRRQKRQRQQHRRLPSVPRDAEDQQGHPSRDASELDSGPDSGFTAIGTGAWIRTKQSRVARLRSHVVPAVTRWRKRLRWPATSWPVLVFGGGRSGEHGNAVSDPELEAWRQRRRSTAALQRTKTLGRPADADGDEDEDEEKKIRQREEALSRVKTGFTTPVAELGDSSVARAVDDNSDGRRTSWLERLSRFLRAPSGDGGSRSSSRNSTDDAEAQPRGGGTSSRADRRSTATATTRWSRWSRWTLRSTDDGLDDGGVVVDTAVEQPIPPLPPPQQLRLLLLLPPPPSAAGGRRGQRGANGRGLSVSPARGEGGGAGGVDKSFARLSNGTFGFATSPALGRRTPLPSRPVSRSSSGSRTK